MVLSIFLQYSFSFQLDRQNNDVVAVGGRERDTLQYNQTKFLVNRMTGVMDEVPGRARLQFNIGQSKFNLLCPINHD